MSNNFCFSQLRIGWFRSQKIANFFSLVKLVGSASWTTNKAAQTMDKPVQTVSLTLDNHWNEYSCMYLEFKEVTSKEYKNVHFYSCQQASTENSDLILVPVYVRCMSNWETYWFGSLMCKNGLLLIFGAFLAWETRKVTVPALNDSKYIGKLELCVKRKQKTKVCLRK